MKVQSIIFLFSAISTSHGFTAYHIGTRRHTAPFFSNREIICVDACRPDQESSLSFSTRRDAIATLLQAPLLISLPALAFGEKEKIEITKESIATYFGEVRFELENPAGGVAHIGDALDANNWEEVKDFTRDYDLELRKKKMGFARKCMTDAKMKDDALALRNAVTFDLIAINKAARVEDMDSARKALQLVKNDVSEFLKFEDQIVLP